MDDNIYKNVQYRRLYYMFRYYNGKCEETKLNYLKFGTHKKKFENYQFRAIFYLNELNNLRLSLGRQKLGVKVCCIDDYINISSDDKHIIIKNFRKIMRKRINNENDKDKDIIVYFH